MMIPSHLHESAGALAHQRELLLKQVSEIEDLAGKLPELRQRVANLEIAITHLGSAPGRVSKWHWVRQLFNMRYDYIPAPTPVEEPAPVAQPPFSQVVAVSRPPEGDNPRELALRLKALSDGRS